MYVTKEIYMRSPQYVCIQICERMHAWAALLEEIVLHTYIHTYIPTYIHAYICMHTYIYICMCVYVYMYIYIYIYMACLNAQLETQQMMLNSAWRRFTHTYVF